MAEGAAAGPGGVGTGGAGAAGFGGRRRGRTSFCSSAFGGSACCSSAWATLSALVVGSLVTSFDVFSPFMIWLKSVCEMVSIGTASGMSSSAGGDDSQRSGSRSAARIVPCPRAERAKPGREKSSFKAGPAYLSDCSVTRATFL